MGSRARLVLLACTSRATCLAKRARASCRRLLYPLMSKDDPALRGRNLALHHGAG